MLRRHKAKISARFGAIDEIDAVKFPVLKPPQDNEGLTVVMFATFADRKWACCHTARSTSTSLGQSRRCGTL